jgi:hypothetical protein
MGGEGSELVDRVLVLWFCQQNLGSLSGRLTEPLEYDGSESFSLALLLNVVTSSACIGSDTKVMLRHDQLAFLFSSQD